MIFLVLAINGQILDAIEIPPELMELPDSKERIRHLSDRLLEDHLAEVQRIAGTRDVYLTGVRSRGNQISDEQLMKEMPKKMQLKILTKNIA